MQCRAKVQEHSQKRSFGSGFNPWCSFTWDFNKKWKWKQYRWFSDINKHGHFPGQKLNPADIRARSPSEFTNKSLLVLTPEATLCAACGIAVSLALPLLTQRCCWIDRGRDSSGVRGRRRRIKKHHVSTDTSENSSTQPYSHKMVR